jgi:hypothetical protein
MLVTQFLDGILGGVWMNTAVHHPLAAYLFIQNKKTAAHQRQINQLTGRMVYAADD